MEKERKKNCRLLAAERAAVAMLVFLEPSNRTCRANLVYMALGSSYLSASEDPIARPKYNFLHAN